MRNNSEGAEEKKKYGRGKNPKSRANLKLYGRDKKTGGKEPGEAKSGRKPGSVDLKSIARRLANTEVTFNLPDGRKLDCSVREAVLFGCAAGAMRGNPQAAETFFKFTGDSDALQTLAEGGDGPVKFIVRRNK